MRTAERLIRAKLAHAPQRTKPKRPRASRTPALPSLLLPSSIAVHNNNFFAAFHTFSVCSDLALSPHSDDHNSSQWLPPRKQPALRRPRRPHPLLPIPPTRVSRRDVNTTTARIFALIRWIHALAHSLTFLAYRHDQGGYPAGQCETLGATTRLGIPARPSLGLRHGGFGVTIAPARNVRIVWNFVLTCSPL